MTKSSFGRRLELLLTDRGMTNKELAQRVGISRQMVTKYINTDTIPSLATACRMAEALGVSVDDLADGDVRGLICT